MTVPFWYDKGGAAAWDTVVLGGFRLPGVARVEGAKAARSLDNKKAKGRSGSSLVDEGYSPSEFAVVLTIYDKQHLAELETLLPKIRPARGSKPSALSISHPSLSLLGISSCYVKEVGGLEPQARGLATLKITLIEFAPLSGSGSGAGKVSGAGLSPKDADNSQGIISLAANGTVSAAAAAPGALGAAAKAFSPGKGAKPTPGE